MIIEKKNPKPKKDVKFAKEEESKSSNKAWTGSSSNLKDGEYLEFENSAYEMLHRAHTEWLLP